MKRRVAPRSLTALIAAVLVASAALPGAAVAQTPDAPSPDSAVTPTPDDDQTEPAPPAPEATPTPTPTASTPTTPAPREKDPAEEKPTPTPAPTSEEPDAERDDSSTPADADVMPVGPLQRCIAESLDGQAATFARTKKLTSVEVDPTCALPAGTLDPDDLPAMDDWDAAEFLPAITTLSVTGFDGVTVPKDGLKDFAKLESASLAGNLLTETPDLGALPELASLDLSDNELTELSMPTAADVPKLARLDVSKNRISDVSGVVDAAAGTTITATDQTLTHPDITAREAQQLADVITVPTAWTDPSWKAGENQMATVDVDAATFSAARPGTWSLSWTLDAGKVSYSGSITGEATAPEPERISFTKPGPVAVGDSATYRADVSNLPAAVRSELDYQWYRGASKSKLKPVDGATGQKFTIDSVAAEDDGSFVKLVATADGAAHQSVPALFAVQPELMDNGFKECLEAEVGEDYDTDDLEDLRSLDCSGREIRSLQDLSVIDPDGNLSLDLSDNLITEIPPVAVVTDDDETRTKQLNLSDNRIVDVSPLAGLDLSDAPANLVVLDGNSIIDVSELGSIELPTTPGLAPISVRRQVVDRPGGPVNTDVPVDVSDAFTVNGGPLDLTLDGDTFEGTVEAAMRTVKSITWDEGTDQGVAFSGTFLVPIGEAPSLGLAFPTLKHVVGDTVSIRGVGFGPGQEITLRARDGQGLFSGQSELKVTADGLGDVRTSFTIGDVTGRFTVDARSGMALLATAEEFEVDADDLVTFPDEGLRTCIDAEVDERPYGQGFYPSQLNRITADFSCRNKEVKDLTGLGAVPSPSIDLTSNDVASLDTVPALNDATTSLDLTNNDLKKLGTVVSQPRLRELNLSQNRLTNLSGLDDKTFAEDAEILAIGQTIALDRRVVGETSEVPEVVGLGGDLAPLFYPEDQGRQNGDRSFTWSAPGAQRIDFNLDQAPDDADSPGLELAGSFLIRVDNAPPVVQPPSDPPAQQAPPAAAVQTLAPAPLVERVEPEVDDEEEPPQAVALGPEVALQETAPTPRVVTNPTVEKREPITSMSGWGLTATGWSLLGAALLAMALAVGIAVLTLGRSTR